MFYLFKDALLQDMYEYRELANPRTASLQRVSIPPIPLASRFLPYVSFNGMHVARWNGLFMRSTDRSFQSVIAIACRVRLILSWIRFLFYSSPGRLSYAKDEAVDGTL